MMNGVMIVTDDVSPLSDLTYKFYHGSWNKLPEWSKIKPKKTGVLNDGFFSIESKDRNKKFGFLFEGKIEVPKDGEYEFYLDSDDGSELRVGGMGVALNDGLHGHGLKAGENQTQEGFGGNQGGILQKDGGDGLYAGWKGPGFGEQALTKAKPKGKAKAPPVPIPIEPLPGEAVIYRNFIDRAGPRAIGVGYAEGVNLAFDANVMRFAIIWRGKFMDGQRHWTGRGQGSNLLRVMMHFISPTGLLLQNWMRFPHLGLPMKPGLRL